MMSRTIDWWTFWSVSCLEDEPMGDGDEEEAVV
jgi:hypothetical protein